MEEPKAMYATAVAEVVESEPIEVEAIETEAMVKGKASTGPFKGAKSNQVHQQHRLPPPPSGMEWVYEAPSKRWALQELVHAEATIVVEDESWDNINDQATDNLWEEHWVQPSDTFGGLCLKYGVTATQLRQANCGFSGTNLSLAPNPLKVPNYRSAVLQPNLLATQSKACPKSDTNIKQPAARIPQGPPLSTWQQEAVHALHKAHRDWSLTEIRCYLELNDWNAPEAVLHLQRDRKERQSLLPWGERARFDIPAQTVAFDEEL